MDEQGSDNKTEGSAQLPAKTSTPGTTEWGQTPSSEEKMLALVAHLLTFIAPVLGAVLVYLIKKDASKFVAYHAMQAIVFQLVCWIIGGFTCGIGVLVGYVFGVLQAMKANSGEWSGYPIIESVGK